MKQRPFAIAAMIAASVAVSARTARAEEGPLVLDERRAVELTIAKHPTIDAAAADAESALAAYRSAQFSRLPDIDLGAKYTRSSGIPTKYRSFDGIVFPQLLDAFGAQATLTVPITDAFLRLAQAASAAGRTADAKAIGLRTVRAQLAHDARAAFLQFWRARLALDAAHELERASDAEARDQRARAEEGTVAKNQALTFEVALDAAKLRVKSAETDVAAAEATLRGYLPPSLATRPLEVPSVKAGDYVAPPKPGVAPAIAALSKEAEAAAATARAETLARLPRLAVVANGEVNAPSPRAFVQTRLEPIPTWDVSVQFQWSLSALSVGGANQRRAEADHAAAMARVEEARRRLDAERSSALSTLRLSRDRIDLAETRARRAEKLAEARRSELEVGTALPADVVLAETELSRARIDLVDATIERALAHARLDLVDGRDIPSTR